MKTSENIITPEMALTIINAQDAAVAEGRSKQRRVNDPRVRQFAADMRAGNWRLSHQGIAFNSDGILIDGQHRLRAIIAAKTPVKMLVTSEIPSDAMDVIDTGAPRPLWQQLGLLHDYVRGTEQVSYGKAAVSLVLGVDQPPPLSPPQFVAIYEKSNLFKACSELWPLIPSKKSRRSGMFAPLMIYWSYRPDKAREFAIRYATLENCTKGDPALMLHKYFAGLPFRCQRNRLHEMCVSCQCLQAFDSGATVDAVKPSREARHWLLTHNTRLVKLVRDTLGLQENA